MLKTKIDEMIELLQTKKRLGYGTIARELSWKEQSVEKISLILEQTGLVATHYSINLLEKPWVNLKQMDISELVDEEAAGKTVDNYEIKDSDGKPLGEVTVFHSKDEHRPRYNIILPRISAYTRAYLEEVKAEVSKTMPMVAEEENDRETFSKMYQLSFLMHQYRNEYQV